MMNETILKILKDPKSWIIAVLVIISTVVYSYMNQERIRVIKEYEQKIEILDSTHVVKQNIWKKDSLYMIDSLKVTLHKLDSMYIREKEKTTIKQIIYRTIYKDSIIEIITTDTEILKERDQTIVSLTDSVANSKKLIVSLNDSITVLLDSLGKKTVNVDTKVKTDSSHTIPAEKKFSIAGGIFGEATNTLKLNYGINGNAEYKIFNPVFIGAGISKDGVTDWTSGYKLNVRIGAKLDF